MAKRPNVLFILADQHGHKVLGHAGHPDVKTPNLDAMAAAGVRCRNAITQNPICTPSRMCWLSGQYAHNHGYYGLSGPNPQGLPTVLGHFKRHGYRTAAIGKIHCPEYWVEDDSDVFHETCGCSINGRSAAYTKFLQDEGVEHLEDHGGFPEFGTQGVQKLDARPSGVTHAQSQEGWSARETIAFMRKAHADGQPFFAHLSLPKPHQCYTPAQEFWDLYDEEAITLPPNADIDLEAAGKAPHLRNTAAWPRGGGLALFEPKTFAAVRRRKMRGYLAQVTQVDHAVGQVRDWLHAQGLAQNTIVIYSADHGEYLYEFGIPEKAPGICCDAVCRIPFLWEWPGTLPAGSEVTDIVETTDMVNTLCGFCGLPAMETADGNDVGAALRGRGSSGHAVGVTEFTWSKSVYDGRYRLVYYPPQMFAEECPEGFGELYDLEGDPWEMHNRYFDTALAAVRARLERHLLDWIISTTRPVTCLPQGRWHGDQWQRRYQNPLNADGKIPPRRLLELGTTNYL